MPLEIISLKKFRRKTLLSFINVRKYYFKLFKSLLIKLTYLSINLSIFEDT